MSGIHSSNFNYLSTRHILTTFLFCDKYLFDFNVADLYSRTIDKDDTELFLFVVEKLYDNNKNNCQFNYFVYSNIQKHHLFLEINAKIYNNLSIFKSNFRSGIVYTTKNKVFFLNYYENCVKS